MGEIVNLRRARKTRERLDAETKARENRAAFGRPKKESDLTAARIALETARLESHRREDLTPETRPDA